MVTLSGKQACSNVGFMRAENLHVLFIAVALGRHTVGAQWMSVAWTNAGTLFPAISTTVWTGTFHSGLEYSLCPRCMRLSSKSYGMFILTTENSHSRAAACGHLIPSPSVSPPLKLQWNPVKLQEPKALCPPNQSFKIEWLTMFLMWASKDIFKKSTIAIISWKKGHFNSKT